MADKRISQLVDRGTVVNSDVVPIVVSGAVTTNKATISSIQTFMQGNLDLGVTSVGITLGSSGTDVSVSGSPVTSSGNITINLPTASATNRGALSSADWSTFNSKQGAITLTTTGTSGASTLVGNTLNIPNYTTDLSGYVTLGTAQTITAQKTFTTSGSSDTMIISHGSGSGFALDVIKAGSGEAIRVQKTSGSGNAMTISGGNFEAPTIVKTGGTSSQFLKADGSVDSSTYLTTGTAASTYLPLVGGTLTGALNGTSAAFTGAVSGSAVTITATTGIAGDFTNNSSTNETLRARNNGSGNIAAFRNLSAEVASITNSGGLTLSGDLNGTTGTFSTASGDNRLNIVTTSGNVPYITLTRTSGEMYALSNTSLGNFQISEAGFDYRFQIAKTTGAATFSSSVMAQSGILQKTLATSTTLEQMLVINTQFGSGIGTGFGGAIVFRGTTAGNENQDNAQIVAYNENASNNGYALGFYTRPSIASGMLQRLTILRDGSVGIGTANPNTKLQVEDGFISTYHNINANGAGYGIQFYTNGGGSKNTIADIGISQDGTTRSGDMIFSTSNAGAPTGRMRITSGGKVLIGTDTSGAGNLIVSDNNNSGLTLRRGSTADRFLFFVGASSPYITDDAYIESSNADIHIRAGSTGGVKLAIGATSFVSDSDIRLKDKIGDIDNALDSILKLETLKFNWKYDSELETKRAYFGLVAQNVQELLPELVEIGRDEMQTLGIKYTELIPVLVKAIQEQQAQIDSLKNQIK